MKTWEIIDTLHITEHGWILIVRMDAEDEKELRVGDSISIDGSMDEIYRVGAINRAMILTYPERPSPNIGIQIGSFLRYDRNSYYGKHIYKF